MVSAELISLLTAADPPPVEVINAESTVPVLLLCEHAGRAVPAALGDLGVTEDVLQSHRGWDIGAEDVARGVAGRLGATLIAQRYSRLVIDANRPPGSPTSILEVSDQKAIPGNRNIPAAARRAREDAIFRPMDHEIERCFERISPVAAISIHSFTRNLQGVERPWHAGFLSRRSIGAADRLMRHIGAARPGLSLALNEPYQIDAMTDWFIPHHAEPRGLAHCLVEIRNDQIDHAEGAALWADLLAGAIKDLMEEMR